MSRAPRPTHPPRERIVVCGVRFGAAARRSPGATQAREPGTTRAEDPAEALSEAAGLVRAADAEVVGEPFLQRKARADAATLMGRGKVDEIKAEVERVRPDAVVVDNELSPAQIRNLEKAWGCRVVDRSELILDIFARRARTRQSQLQVELAQNEYLMPRLRRMWTHLERMEGAIGTRGPGETQLETDRRLLRHRVHELRSELTRIEERKRREVRARAEPFKVGLVGYTNAGKSTLLNALTGAHEFATDMLFATLDTRTRRWVLSDSRVVLLSDTVGFLEDLPHDLVASFHATLEETLHADLLLHVVDASHAEALEQMRAVDDVLRLLMASPSEQILVFNKLDRLADRLHMHLLAGGRPWSFVGVSARTGEGLERLDELVRARLDERSALVDVLLPSADGRVESDLRRLGGILAETLEEDGCTRRVRSRLTPGALGALRRLAGGDVRFEILERPAIGGEILDLPRPAEPWESAR